MAASGSDGPEESKTNVVAGPRAHDLNSRPREQGRLMAGVATDIGSCWLDTQWLSTLGLRCYIHPFIYLALLWRG